MNSQLLHSYQNGNCQVTIYADGTKTVEYHGMARPNYPNSLDLKITNYCDNPHCITYCFEKSNKLGLHADLEYGLNVLSDLPSGTEVAIGGGNPLFHPELEYFLTELSDRGIICNLTVNQYHIDKYIDRINDYIDRKLIYGLGISYIKDVSLDCISKLKNIDNCVWHVIAGIHSIDDIKRLLAITPVKKVLVLGYKRFGNGLSNYIKDTNTIDKLTYQWYTRIHELFNINGITVSFDNLGIKQLNIKRFFTDVTFNEFFMGDDGKFTFFIDLVKQEYCITSTAKERYSLNGISGTKEILAKFN